jgi:flagellar basal-body rod protein FlgG
MLNGLYSAAAGMAAQQQRMDALANDIVNINTTGYKQARLGFRDLLYNRERSVQVGAGAAILDLGRNLAQGALKQVDDPLSVAIDGPGFFQVRRPDGSLALTRAGDFRLDSQGSLVTGSGFRVAPPITVPTGVAAGDVKIAADGTVSAGGRALGRLVVVQVPAPSQLEAAGSNVFVPNARSGAPRPQPSAAVRQGFVEMSNVDFADAMVDVLDAQRAFEMSSRTIRTQDQLMEIANGIRR